MAHQNGISSALRVFADTASGIALLNKNDALHAKALVVRHTLRQRRVRIATTEFVLVVVADGLSAPAIRRATISSLNALRQEVSVDIVPLSATLLTKGWERYAQRPDKGWGLTDCTSFVVTQEQGLSEAFTSNHHFAQAGFTCLL